MNDADYTAAEKNIHTLNGIRFQIVEKKSGDLNQLIFYLLSEKENREFYRVEKDTELIGFLPDEKIPRKEYQDKIFLRRVHLGNKKCLVDILSVAVAAVKNKKIDKITVNHLKIILKSLRIEGAVKNIYLEMCKKYFNIG